MSRLGKMTAMERLRYRVAWSDSSTQKSISQREGQVASSAMMEGAVRRLPTSGLAV